MTQKLEINKKILIISHNAMNASSNCGRTIMEMFCSCESENLAQLFLHKDTPNSNICTNYYSVTDFDIRDSLIKFKKPGKRVQLNEAGATKEEEVRYGEGSKRKSHMVFMRNLAWGFNTWFTKDLKKWLNEFNPDIIFFMGGCYVFSHKLALKISRYLKKPMITFWGDDYYLNNALKNGILGGINNSYFKYIMRKTIRLSEYICLDEMMEKDYSIAFKKAGHCIYTSSSMKPFADKLSNERITMSFLGNISIQRYKSLKEIASIIQKEKLQIDLNVYTGEKRAWILENIIGVNGLNYKGAVDYCQVLEIMGNSDILVHVEDFSESSINEVKYSFSTKIADSLCSNRCLFAYGPASVASIKYLIDNKCAIVATNSEELEENLKNIVSNRKIMSEFASRGLQVASSNHNSEINWGKIVSIVEKVSK
ncbi:MAG: glycosyltransferase [Clostridia bacterium]